MRNLASFSTLLNFELPAFENAASYPNYKQNCYAVMIALYPRHVWWRWVHVPLRKVC